MIRPEMIIFDYGHTLLYQPNHNTSNGNKALYNYISENPRNISFAEFDKTIIDIFQKIKVERGPILEIQEYNFLKTALEYMDIKLAIWTHFCQTISLNLFSSQAIISFESLIALCLK